MGHEGASGKTPNDAPWETLNLSRPISAPLLTAVRGTCGAPAPLLPTFAGILRELESYRNRRDCSNRFVHLH